MKDEYMSVKLVREIRKSDIELLADYWFNSDPGFLTSMGADKEKLPTKSQFIQMLTEQVDLPYKDKKSYALIWEMDGKQIGHSNVNNILYENEATVHLHLWELGYRKRGLGSEFVKKSLLYYFKNLKLNKIICEPYALNPAPNKTLKKVGFNFVKRYTTIPGTINFQQKVNRWEMKILDFEKLYEG